jgi:hypothetical protein
MASISSKNTTVGAFSRALLKTSRTSFLALADVLVQQFGAFDRDKVRFGLVGDSLRQQRLARARWAVEHDAFRGGHIELLEDLGVFKRPLDRFAESLLGFVEAADILPRYVGNFDEHLPERARFDPFERVLEVGFEHLD